MDELNVLVEELNAKGNRWLVLGIPPSLPGTSSAEFDTLEDVVCVGCDDIPEGIVLCASCQHASRETPVDREYRYRKQYDLECGQYAQMLDDQGGVCAICFNDNNGWPLFVDHCHRTGVVRALLCRQCNSGLGQFRDDPERMERAAAYIREHDKHV